MEESTQIVVFINLALHVLTILVGAFMAIRSNHFRSKCCGGWCEVEDDLAMQDKSTQPPVIKQPEDQIKTLF